MDWIWIVFGLALDSIWSQFWSQFGSESHVFTYYKHNKHACQHVYHALDKGPSKCQDNDQDSNA